MNIYLSSGAFKGGSLTDMLEVCRQLGVGLELGTAIALKAQDEADMKRAAADVPLLVHNYLPAPEEPFVVNLASLDPETHERSLAHCRYAIELCARLGSPFYSVHAGFALHLEPTELGDPVVQRNLPPERRIDRPAAYDCFLETVALLADFAAERDVRLLVENNVSAGENLDARGESPMLLSFPDEICRFFTDLGKPSVGLLFDTGHAKVSARTLGTQEEIFFEQVSPFVAAFHLSENDGLRDTNGPMNVDSWFMPFLKRTGNIPMVIEVYLLDFKELAAQCELLCQL